MKHRLILLVLLLCGWASPATAAVSLHPATLDLRFKAGESERRTVSLRNTSDQMVRLQSEGIALADLTPLVAAEGLDWLLPSKEVVIPPHGVAELVVEARDLEGLSPGGHYAAIKLTQIEAAGAPVTANPVLMIPIFAVKEGGEKLSMELVSLRLGRDRLGALRKVLVTWRATGNTHVVPRGVLTLRDGRAVVWRQVLNESSGRVLPGQARTYTLDSLPALSGWRPRQLSLTLESRVEGEETIQQTVREFWYVPPGWWAVAGAVLLLLVIGIGRLRIGDK